MQHTVMIGVSIVFLNAVSENRESALLFMPATYIVRHGVEVTVVTVLVGICGVL